MLYCLNLPPHLRLRPENMFMAGITPPPHVPNTMTISHLLDPVITSILKYHAPGLTISTFWHPDGVPIVVKAVPLIADLEGNNKCSGFLSHSAEQYCSFCLAPQSEIENLDIFSWPLRNGAVVRNDAALWLQDTTKVARATRESKTGVRWTSLHRLPYWDPVNHTILGPLHNWDEGVLKHHLRSLCGIGRDEKDEQKLKEADIDEQWTEGDVSDSASELEDLLREAAQHSPEVAWAMEQAPPPGSPSPSPFDDSSSLFTPTQALFPLDPDTHDHYDPDFIPPISSNQPPFDFSEAQLQAIRTCIQDITLPTWVPRPPTNLGEPSHGKLKAHEYLTLFICIFPLIIPELWHGLNMSDFDNEQLECFHHLVSATNIISSFTTSHAKADQFTQHYIKYRALIQRLYPQFASKPNHHYAMHNGDLMKRWGPLASLSEFFGERVNGMLQNVNTNQKLSKSSIILIEKCNN